MHISSVLVKKFRNLERLTVPLNGLTVVFGANGIGKSNLLEAVASALSASAPLRSAPAVAEPIPTGFIEFMFDDCWTTGTDDGALLHFLVLSCLGGSTPELQAICNNDLQLGAGPFGSILQDWPRVRSCGLGDLKATCDYVGAFFAREITRMDYAISLELWNWLLEAPRLSYSSRVIRLVRPIDGMPEHLRRAVDVMIDEPIHGNAISDIAVLTAVGDPGIFLTHGEERPLDAISIVRLEPDPASLEVDLDDLLESIHDGIWAPVEVDLDDEDDWPELRPLRVPEPDLLHGLLRSTSITDPWLDTFESGAVRVRPTVEYIARLIAEHANEVAPPFIQRGGAIEITVRPISQWAGTRSRLSIALRLPHSPDPIPLALLGSGTARWVDAAVREACRGLVESEVRVEPSPGNDPEVNFPEGDLPEYMRQQATAMTFNAELIDAATDGTADRVLDVQRKPAPAIYFVDEPELHLHPTAQLEVADWLAGLSRSNALVLVASHSPAFLNMTSQSANFYGLVQEDSRVRLVPLNADLLGTLDTLAEDLGLSRADLILMIRGGLIVEGEHDRLVIDHFFGTDIRRQRLAVLQLRGTRNALALIDSDLLHALGRPLWVLFDGTRESVVRGPASKRSRRKGLSSEELAMLRLMDLADDGHDLRPVAFALPDIICALPMEAIRRAYPSAPLLEWEQIIQRWRQAPRENFKDFALRTMGIQDRATRFLHRVLDAVVSTDQPHPALRQAMQHVFASASEI
jgi:AAA domain, putative AbiEii toxin, Type IV TA system/Protein of unknown function (DUF2813)